MGYTLGEWQQTKDTLLSFYRPVSTDYHGITTSAVEHVFLDTLDKQNVAVEGNLFFSLSIPALTPADVLSGMDLKKKVGDVYQEVTYENPSSPTGLGYIYQAVKIDQNNSFYFPLSIAGAAGQKNLEYNTEYELVIPAIKLANGLTIDAPTPILFKTQSAMGPTKMNTTPSINPHDGVVDVSWTATTDFYTGSTPPVLCNLAATSYNVYRSTNQYFGYTKITASPITGTSYTDSTLLGSGSYYYRITPITNNYEGGFSNISNVVTIP